MTRTGVFEGPYLNIGQEPKPKKALAVRVVSSATWIGGRPTA